MISSKKMKICFDKYTGGTTRLLDVRKVRSGNFEKPVLLKITG